jgi:hypothetical protein
MRTISALLMMSCLLGCSSKQEVTQPAKTFTWSKAEQQLSSKDIVRIDVGSNDKVRK